MRQLWKSARIPLEILGVVFLMIIVVRGVRITRFVVGNHAAPVPKVDQATAKDLTFVLNWGELGDKCSILEVVHSYESGKRSPDGDHSNAYCLKIDCSPESLAGQELFGSTVWMAGPVDSPILRSAISTACGWPQHDNLDWFPSEEEVNSERFYICFPRVIAYNQQVEAVQMAAYDRHDGLLYYADVAY